MVERHEARNPVVRARDEMGTVEEVVEAPEVWEPDRNDMRGVDTRGGPGRRVASVDQPDYPGQDPGYHHAGEGDNLGERVESIGAIAPVMGNPSLDPAGGSMVAVSYMAGYGRETEVGYDAMDGISGIALSHRDATAELAVEDPTPGDPLEIAPGESVYGDTTRLETRNTRGRDWCADLRLADNEGWM